jgi:EcsC protein family
MPPYAGAVRAAECPPATSCNERLRGSHGITKRKLAQAVPVVGAAINASVNAGLTHQTFRRAEAVYRLRFLSEKYGIDPDEWRRDAPVGSAEAEDVVQVDEASGTVRRLGRRRP